MQLIPWRLTLKVDTLANWQLHAFTWGQMSAQNTVSSLDICRSGRQCIEATWVFSMCPTWLRYLICGQKNLVFIHSKYPRSSELAISDFWYLLHTHTQASQKSWRSLTRSLLSQTIVHLRHAYLRNNRSRSQRVRSYLHLDHLSSLIPIIKWRRSTRELL